MIISKKQFPIVLTVVEDFGLSIRESGNAIMAANPKHFYEMWQKYPHTFLTTKNIGPKSDPDRFMDIVRLSTGRTFPPEAKHYRSLIESGALRGEGTKNLLAEIKVHNSALHLFATVSERDNNSFSLDNACALAKEAKAFGLYRVFIHLIIDDSMPSEKLRVKIRQFADIVTEQTQAEIATFVGLGRIRNDKDVLVNENTAFALISGTGKRTISVDQAISSLEPEADQTEVTSIIYRSGFSAKIDDFDSIVFCDFDCAKIAPLVESFVPRKNEQSKIKIPRFVTVSTICNSPDINLLEVKALIPTPYTDTLPQILTNNNIPFKIITDSANAKITKMYFVSDSKIDNKEDLFLTPYFSEDSKIEEYRPVLSQIISYLSEENLPDLIYIHIPVICYAASSGNFSETIKAVEMVDQFLPLLEKTVLARKGTFVLTSNHSGAEQITGRSKEEIRDGKTFNPVPLIISTGYVQAEEPLGGSNAIKKDFFDMIKKASRDVDVCPTVLDLLGLSQPESVEGRSSLSSLLVSGAK